MGRARIPLPPDDGHEPPGYRDGGRLVVAVGPDEERERPRGPRQLPGLVRLPEGYSEIAVLRHRAAAGDDVLGELFALEVEWFASRWPLWRRPEDAVTFHNWAGLPEDTPWALRPRQACR